MASKYGGRVQLGRMLAEDTGGGLDSPDALIEDTVLAELIKERMRYANEYGDNAELPNNMLDTQLKNIYLGNGILDRIAPVEHIDIPEDPEIDHIIDEANLSPESIFSGGPRKKKPAPEKDSLAAKVEDTEAAEKKAAAKKKREDKIRETVVDMLLKQGNELTDEQKALTKADPEKPMEALTDIVNWDKRVDKDLRKDQIKRDKPYLKKVALARKVIAYADDPEQFGKTWYKDHPVYAKRRLPDGTIEKKEIIYNDDNPDPDLEGIDLVRYADAMNEKFPPNKDGFIEYDYGPPTKSGDTAHPADILKAAARGKEFTEPAKLEFPEIHESNIDPKKNRLGMVRRMLFGELSNDELAYLMDLIGQDQQFMKGGYVDNKAFRFLQKRYGPNHPVLSDKRFKKQFVGKLATTVRRVI